MSLIGLEVLSCVWSHGVDVQPLTRSPTSSSLLVSLLLEENQADFCSTCFDEVCSRCSGGLDGANDSEEVRIDGFPVCAVPPVGAVASSSGTSVATLSLEKGYFRTSNQSHDVRKCYHEVACRGGSDANEYCTSGYTGPCETPVVTGKCISGLCRGEAAARRSPS